MNVSLARFAPYILSLLRVATAIVFIPHGTQKLFYIPNAPHPPLPMFSQIWFAGVLEVFGGALMLLGLFSRPVAFLLAGEMAVAYFQEHAPHGWLPILNEGELAVLCCFIWLYISAAGPGPWSLDAIVRKRR
jgi:putative oxidoreductase